MAGTLHRVRTMKVRSVTWRRRLFLPVVIIVLLFGVSVYHVQPVLAGEKPLRAYTIRYLPGYAELVRSQVLRSGGTVSHELSRLNAIAVSLPGQAIAAIQKNPWISYIEPVARYEPTRLPQSGRFQPFFQYVRRSEIMPWFVRVVQAAEAWDVDQDGLIDPGTPDGSGVTICIIDTGLNPVHDDLAGLTVDGFSQISGQNWNEDGSGHGTHVTGIVGAQNNSLGMVGVLPRASIFVVKIFNNAGQWVEGESNLAAAVYACRDAGANVVNMSLAGDFSVTDQAAIQELYDRENMLFFSTSANNGSAAIAFPGYYESVINTGSIDRSLVVSSFSQYPPARFDPLMEPVNAEWDAVEMVAGGQIVASTFLGNRDYPVYMAEVDGEVIRSSRLFGYPMTLGIVSGNLVDGNLCQASDVSPAWSGAVVLCQRGLTLFSDKIFQVEGAGGAAILIYNNVAGEFPHNCVGCSALSLPSLRLTRDEGIYLLANKLGKNITLTLDDGSDCGLNCTGAYAFYNGTSQAAPAASAAAAWLWDACGGPGVLSNIQIRKVLRESSQDLSGTHPTAGFSYGAGWDPATGWGIPQMKSALIEANRLYGNLCPLPVDVIPEVISVCTPTQSSQDLSVSLSPRFTSATSLSLSGAPDGMLHSFSTNPLSPPTTTTSLSLSNLELVASGVYTLTVRASEDSNPANTDIDSFLLYAASQPPDAPRLISPEPGSTGGELRPRFTWESIGLSTEFQIKVALDREFTQVIETAGNLQTKAYQLQGELAPGTIYYWQVTGQNECGRGVTATGAFRTTDIACQAFPGETGLIESGVQTAFTNTISLAGNVVDVNIRQLQGSHAATADLTFWLYGPGGRAVKLIPGSCPGADFNLGFDDRSNQIFDCTLNNADVRRSLNPLANFAGEVSGGDWFLAIANNGAAGTLSNWELEVCQPALQASKDYSDHPASYGAAWHTGNGSLRLGDLWSSDSSFDQERDNPSDDGITNTDHWWESGKAINLQVIVKGGNGWLVGWVDWNENGDFDTPAEQVANRSIEEGQHTLQIQSPSTYFPGQPVHLRFRLYPAEPTSPASAIGEAAGGEVEDYWWPFLPTRIHLTQLRAESAKSGAQFQLAVFLFLMIGSIITTKILYKETHP